MQLSREADYAVRAVVYVARFPNGTKISTKEISKWQLIPMQVLIKIIARLAKNGLLRTQRGIGGGIFLGRAPEEITLLEVIESIQGPIALNRCVRHPEECPLSGVCAVHDIWCEAQKQLVGLLRSVTVADIVRRQKEKILKKHSENKSLK
jgi:Rrf2 family protein